VHNFLEVFREVDELKTDVSHVLNVVLEDQKSSLVVNSDSNGIRAAGFVDDVFAESEVQRSQESGEVIDLDLGVELRKEGQELVDNDGLKGKVESFVLILDVSEEGFGVSGQADDVLAFFDQEVSFSDLFGAQVQDVMLLDVGDEVLLGEEVDFGTQKRSSAGLGVFSLSVFVKKRGNAEDGKDESVGLVGDFFSSHGSHSALEEDVMVEVRDGAVKVEF